jgi:hypothetical protein
MRQPAARHVLIGALLATSATTALADWVKVAETGQSVIYLDPAVSRKVGDNVMVWLLRDHAARRVGAGGPFRSSKDQVEVDCRARRVRLIYSSDHPKPMGEGRFVHSEHGPMSWNAAPPQSVMGRVVALACVER